MNLSDAIKSLGTLSLLNFARKHLEKLLGSGDEALAAGAEPIRVAIAPLDAAYAARRPLTSLWNQAASLKDAADDALDAAISEMSYELLGPAHLKGDRKSPLYRGLFPEGNVRFIHGPDRAELVQVSAMVAYLKANLGHPMAGRASELEMKAAALDAALGPVVGAESALRQAEALEREKREALRRALRKSAAVLRAELMDEKKVEALFPTVAESKVSEEETPAV